jgi:predicted RND superfamily exporter protein
VSSFIRRLITFACRRSILIFGATAALSAFFGYQATRLRVDPNVESLIPESAKITELTERYREKGVSGEYLVVAVQSEDPFRIDRLQAFGRVLGELGELPELQHGITPFNFLTFERQDGRLVLVSMADGQRAPESQPELERFVARITSTPYARNLIISRDATVLAAFFPAGEISDFDALMARIRGIVSTLDGTYRYYISGSIPFVERTGVYLSRDLGRLFGLTALIILGFYFFGFRSLRGVVLPFLVVVLGTVWCMGFMALLGYSLTIVNIITPPLVLTLGSSYSIHLLNQYYRGARGATPDGLWVVAVVEHVSRTIMIAAATTIVGFLSLLVTTIRQTREFALAAGFGIVACALLSLVFLPALLSRLSPPREVQVRRVRSGAISRSMLGLARFVLRRRVAIAVAVGAVAAGFVVSMFQLNTNTDTIGYFPRRDRVVQDMYFLTSKLGGFDEINLTLSAPGGASGYFLRPEVLKEVSGLELALRSLPDITYSMGFTTYLRFANQVLTGQDAIPSSRGPILLLSRYVRVLSQEGTAGSATANLANDDFSQLRLSFRIYNARTQKFIDEQGLRDLLGRMDRVISAGLPSDIGRELWGTSLQYLTLADLLRRNLVKAMLLSVLLVFSIAAASFRSIRFGLLTIVPLVTGVMLNFVLMALAGIPLDLTTIMVSSVAVGVGVDDAIHFLLHYRSHLSKAGYSGPKALSETMVVTGRPILLTTISIVAGLLVLTVSGFRPIVYFGVLVVFTLSATCASTLIVLPALLSLSRKFGRASSLRGLR